MPMINNKYLLDTNICIALLRGNRDIAKKIIDLGEGACHLSVITLYELMFGAYYSKREKQEVPKVKQFVERFPIVPLVDAVEEYAIIWCVYNHLYFLINNPLFTISCIEPDTVRISCSIVSNLSVLFAILSSSVIP